MFGVDPEAVGKWKASTYEQALVYLESKSKAKAELQRQAETNPGQ